MIEENELQGLLRFLKADAMEIKSEEPEVPSQAPADRSRRPRAQRPRVPTVKVAL